MKRITLLLKEIPDKYVQDNFRRLKTYLDDIAVEVGGITTNVNNFNAESEWDRKEDLIIASTSRVVDRIDYSTFHSARHVFTLYNDVEGVSKTFDITTSKFGGDVSDSEHSRLGDSIDAYVVVTLNTGYVEYTLTNNESYDLRMVITKITH